MIPSTFVGLLLFIVVLAPGLCFNIAWEARRPRREVSLLHEGGTVVLTSLAVAAVVAAVFGLLRSAVPRHTPDVGALLGEDPVGYVKAHLAYVLAWCAGLLVAGCVGGFGLGKWAAKRALSRKSPDDIRYVSAWYSVFYEMQREFFKDCFVHLGCYLDDGTWVGGYLKTFSPDLEETADRDLVLLPPVTRRTLDGETEERDLTAVIVSARRLVQLEVSFVSELPVDNADHMTSKRGAPATEG